MNQDYESLRQSLLEDVEKLRQALLENQLPPHLLRFLTLRGGRWLFDESIHDRLFSIERQIESLQGGLGKGCALAGTQDGDRIARFLSGVGDLKQERKVIRNWLAGCRDLIIVDPYLLGGGPKFNSDDEYVDTLFSDARLSGQVGCFPPSITLEKDPQGSQGSVKAAKDRAAFVPNAQDSRPCVDKKRKRSGLDRNVVWRLRQKAGFHPGHPIR